MQRPPMLRPALASDGSPWRTRFVCVAMVGGMLLAAACARTPTPQPTASVTVNFELALGGSGFSLTVYAQEVTTGRTYSQLYSSGAHGGVVLPTSAPLVFSLDAPGTYVFYSNMINAPDDYHFGATGCAPGPECTQTDLKAIDVVPGETYAVYFSDRSGERHAPVPTPHAPVSVPWQR